REQRRVPEGHAGDLPPKVHHRTDRIDGWPKGVGADSPPTEPAGRGREGRGVRKPTTEAARVPGAACDDEAAYSCEATVVFDADRCAGIGCIGGSPRPTC